MDAYRVIKRPHNSEKCHDYIEATNTYTFVVDGEASKDDIRAAIKQIWDVDAESIRTINMPGKNCRFGRLTGHTGTWKKAMVRLPKDQAIEALR